MKKAYFILPFLFLVPFVKVSSQILNVPSIIQEQSEWCWAGTSDCVLQYFKDTNQQCTIAEYARSQVPSVFGVKACCLYPGDSCNTPNYMYNTTGSIQDILYHFKRISSTGMGTDLDTAQTLVQLKKGTPFFFRWGWNTGGGHFLVGYGMVDSNLYYMNPLSGYEIADFSWVIYNVTHTWTNTLELDTTVATGISSIMEAATTVNVYPNPSKGIFTFSIGNCVPQITGTNIEVYNVLGERMLSQFSTLNSQLSIDLSNQPNGVYFYRVISENGGLLGAGKLVVLR